MAAMDAVGVNAIVVHVTAQGVYEYRFPEFDGHSDIILLLKVGHYDILYQVCTHLQKWTIVIKRPVCHVQVQYLFNYGFCL